VMGYRRRPHAACRAFGGMLEADGGNCRQVRGV
jgi:hypothetical protein